jgi:hypothetical protein
MHRTTIRLNEHLLVRTKEYAVQHRKTLTAVIEDALRVMLAQTEQPARRSVRFPTYGKGGTLPGVPSLDSWAEVLDFMEKDLPIEKRR